MKTKNYNSILVLFVFIPFLSAAQWCSIRIDKINWKLISYQDYNPIKKPTSAGYIKYVSPFINTEVGTIPKNGDQTPPVVNFKFIKYNPTTGKVWIGGTITKNEYHLFPVNSNSNAVKIPGGYWKTVGIKATIYAANRVFYDGNVPLKIPQGLSQWKIPSSPAYKINKESKYDSLNTGFPSYTDKIVLGTSYESTGYFEVQFYPKSRNHLLIGDTYYDIRLGNYSEDTTNALKMSYGEKGKLNSMKTKLNVVFTGDTTRHCFLEFINGTSSVTYKSKGDTKKIVTINANTILRIHIDNEQLDISNVANLFGGGDASSFIQENPVIIRIPKENIEQFVRQEWSSVNLTQLKPKPLAPPICKDCITIPDANIYAGIDIKHALIFERSVTVKVRKWR